MRRECPEGKSGLDGISPYHNGLFPISVIRAIRGFKYRMPDVGNRMPNGRFGWQKPRGRGRRPESVDERFRLGHIGHSMSAVAKSRIDPELKRQAEAVLEEIGLKPRAALELFYKQIIKRRAIPFPVQADSPDDEVLSPAARRNALADEF